MRSRARRTLSGGAIIETLGNPGLTTYPSDAYARNVWDMFYFDGAVHIGIGNSKDNAAAPPIWKYTPASNSFSDADGVSYAEHKVYRFRLVDDVLTVPGHDPTSGTSGRLYRYNEGTDAWAQAITNIPNTAHVYDVVSFGGALFAAVGRSSGTNAVYRSTDDGANWTAFTVPQSGYEVGGTASRAWTFFEIGSTLHVSTSAVIFTAAPYASGFVDPWLSAFYWTGSQWDVTSQNLAPDDTLQIQYTETEPGSEIYVITGVGRVVDAVEFGDYTFYTVGETEYDHDARFTKLYRIADGGAAVRQTFMGAAVCFDLLVHEGRLFALCNEASGARYHTTVWATINGEDWARVFAFSPPGDGTFARAMATDGDEFYFGLGCYYDAQSTDAGTIMRSRGRRVAALGSVAAVDPFIALADSYVDAAQLIGWWRLNIASGTAITNEGSIGGALNGTLTLGSGSLAQVGQLGAGEAIDFVASGTLVNCGNTASANGLNEITVFGVLKPDNAGGSNAGRIFDKGGEWGLRFAAVGRTLTSTIFSTGNGSATTSTTVPLAWATVAMTYSHAGDKTPHIYINGVEASYSPAPTAATGTRNSNTNAIVIGNTSGAAAGHDGLFDEAMVFNVALSAAAILALHQATGI